MNKVILVVIVLLVFISCNFLKSGDSKLMIQVNVMERLSNNLFYDKSGIYDSVKIKLSNVTDTVFRFWSMSCSWTYNWITNNENIYLRPIDCFANVPVIDEIRPGENISFKGIIHVLDTLSPLNESELKLGFVLIKGKEVMKYSDFLKVLDTKISEKEDIIWSEPFKIKE